jgi:hypothetical protein
MNEQKIAVNSDLVIHTLLQKLSEKEFDNVLLIARCKELEGKLKEMDSEDKG